MFEYDISPSWDGVKAHSNNCLLYLSIGSPNFPKLFLETLVYRFLITSLGFF